MPLKDSQTFDDRQPTSLQRWQLLQRLGGRTGGRPTAALCPAHPDRNKSMTVTDAGDRVLVHCHRGCSIKAIVEAVGLKVSDLFDNETWADIRRHRLGDPTAIFEYRDSTGALLGCKTRFDPRSGRTYRWSRVADGEAKRPPGATLYGAELLDEAIAAGRQIWLTEGERDADVLRAQGEVAVSVYAGAETPVHQIAGLLEGADVKVWTDADAHGWQLARRLASGLDGIATSVRIVQAAPGAKDAADHFDAGYALEDVRPCDPDLELARAELDAGRATLIARSSFGARRSDPTRRALLQELARRADHRGHVRIAGSTLAEAIGRSRSKTCEHLAVLIELGVVQRVRSTTTSASAGSSTLYRLASASEWRWAVEEIAEPGHSSGEGPLPFSTYKVKCPGSAIASAPAHDAHRFGALNHRGDEIRTALLAGPGTGAEIARRLGPNAGAVYYHLRKAVAAGTATYDETTRLYTAVEGDDVLDRAAEHYGTSGAGDRQRAGLRRAAAARKRRWRAWVHRKHHTPPIEAYEGLADVVDVVDDEATAEPTRAELAAIERGLEHRRAMRSRLTLVG